jgi:hypothetical protein
VDENKHGEVESDAKRPVGPVVSRPGPVLRERKASTPPIPWKFQEVKPSALTMYEVADDGSKAFTGAPHLKTLASAECLPLSPHYDPWMDEEK